MPAFYCPVCNHKSLTEKEEKEHAKTHNKQSVQPTEPDIKKKEKQKKDYSAPDLNFIKRFLHKIVSIALINGSTISGRLTGFNAYDLMLDDKILIPKHAMLTMQEVEPKPSEHDETP